MEKASRSKLILQLSKKTLKCSKFLVPLNLPESDSRDFKIGDEIYGIEKAIILSDYVIDHPRISQAAAKYIMIMNWNLLKPNGQTSPWSYLDNLDKKYCLGMAIHFEIELNGNGITKGELPQMCRKADVTMSDEKLANVMRSGVKLADKMKSLGLKQKSKVIKKDDIPVNVTRALAVSEGLEEFAGFVRKGSTMIKKFEKSNVNFDELSGLMPDISAIKSENNLKNFLVGIGELGLSYKKQENLAHKVKELTNESHFSLQKNSKFSSKIEVEDQLVPRHEVGRDPATLNRVKEVIMTKLENPNLSIDEYNTLVRVINHTFDLSIPEKTKKEDGMKKNQVGKKN